jgi:hypothetical protein
METVATNVINPPRGATVEFSSIAKTCKYKGLHEGHHFILMVTEVHDTPKRDMDHFIKECVLLFHDRRLRYHLSLSFYIQFFKQHVSITLQCFLTSIIERKIVLVGDVSFRSLITFRSHNLHEGNIKTFVDEKTSYHERD